MVGRSIYVLVGWSRGRKTKIRSKIVMVDCRSLLGSLTLPLWLGCDISAANVVKFDGSVICQPGAHNRGIDG